MSKIKDAIKKGTKTKSCIFDKNITVDIEGKFLIRRITIRRMAAYAITMEIVCIPFTEKAICRSIYMINILYPSRSYIIKNQIRPCTLDDIEDWINKHFQEG